MPLNPCTPLQGWIVFSSIKTAIISIILFLVLTVSSAVLFFVVYEYKTLYSEAVSENLTGLTTNISRDLEATLIEGKEAFKLQNQIEQKLQRLAAYENVVFANVAFVDGQHITDFIGDNSIPRARFKDVLATLPSGFQTGVYEHGGYLVSVHQIGDTPFTLGYLQIVHNLEKTLLQSQFRLLTQTFPTVSLTTLLVILVAMVLLNRLLQPLAKLSTFTKQIEASKNYTLRFRTSGNNEVAQLANNVNTMLDTINLELQKNKTHTEKLEEQREAMTRLANYDTLTNLPNRQFIMDTLRYKLADAKRNGQDLYLLFFDLDGFKGINDSLGHEAGDVVLVEVGKRVQNMLREGDMLSRLGGDEFLIVPYDEPSIEDIKQICVRLLETIEQPIIQNGIELRVGLSIGIASAKEANYELTELVSNADIAMYRSKATGRDTFTLFHKDLIQDYKRKLLISNSVLRGLENNEFHLVYQAKINQFGKLIGFEALIRWFHHDLGNISPGEFIPIAEQAGKIPQITQFVIQRVCREMPQIQQLSEDKLVVSLNLSAYDLESNNLVEFIKQEVAETSTDMTTLEFEVTETAYLENFDKSNAALKELSKLGCKIALDDFGTGYSSLSYLTQIKIDTLKIDQSFVREIDFSSRSRLVTSTIIDLAKSLNLQICAEGIESRAQQMYLSQLGCDYYQGYLYSKPLALHDLIEKDFDFIHCFKLQEIETKAEVQEIDFKVV